jgi:SAM-dependent methyltransferase
MILDKPTPWAQAPLNYACQGVRSLYNADFYSFLASFASKSAEHVVPLLKDQLTIRSVADFGCGQGAWLSVWRKLGVSAMGVDGPHVDHRSLMIDTREFRVADLSLRIDLGRRFDLVQSLEVAEHLPGERASDFIQVLTAHAPFVMFSAAVPGQGGEHHVNEQPLEYWRAKFRDHGYLAVDYIRPQISGNILIQNWYRYNIVLYIDESRFQALPANLQAFRVPDDESLAEYWPLQERIQHALVRQLPRGAVDHLSRLKSRAIARKARSANFVRPDEWPVRNPST